MQGGTGKAGKAGGSGKGESCHRHSLPRHIDYSVGEILISLSLARLDCQLGCDLVRLD